LGRDDDGEVHGNQTRLGLEDQGESHDAHPNQHGCTDQAVACLLPQTLDVLGRIRLACRLAGTLAAGAGWRRRSGRRLAPQKGQQAHRQSQKKWEEGASNQEP